MIAAIGMVAVQTAARAIPVSAEGPHTDRASATVLGIDNVLVPLHLLLVAT